jgi:hypothetical protein
MNIFDPKKAIWLAVGLLFAACDDKVGVYNLDSGAEPDAADAHRDVATEGSSGTAGSDSGAD